MSIKSKLFKGLAVVSLLLPIAFSSNSINNANASTKKTHAVKVVNHNNATDKFADEMYNFSNFFKKDLLPTIKNYKATTKPGKSTKKELLAVLDNKMSKKQFRKVFEKSMKNNPEFKKTSAKERNKMISESTKSLKNVKLSDLTKISSLAKRWTLVLLQVNDGKTTIHLPAMK